MKTIAYLRVSKDTQDVKNQKLAILEYAQKEKIEIYIFIELSISSRKSTKDFYQIDVPMFLHFGSMFLHLKGSTFTVVFTKMTRNIPLSFHKISVNLQT